MALLNCLKPLQTSGATMEKLLKKISFLNIPKNMASLSLFKYTALYSAQLTLFLLVTCHKVLVSVTERFFFGDRTLFMWQKPISLVN